MVRTVNCISEKVAEGLPKKPAVKTLQLGFSLMGSPILSSPCTRKTMALEWPLWNPKGPGQQPESPCGKGTTLPQVKPWWLQWVSLDLNPLFSFSSKGDNNVGFSGSVCHHRCPPARPCPSTGPSYASSVLCSPSPSLLPNRPKPPPGHPIVTPPGNW